MKNIILTVITLFSFITIARAQTVPSYVPANGLAAWYSFTGNANDDSGAGNHGAINGATLTTGKKGVANTAYAFDGMSNIIDLPNTFLSGTQVSAFSFHALVFLNSTNTDLVIWSKTLFWGEISFNITNLNGVRFGWANSISGNKYSTIRSQSNVIQPNQWYDIVVNFNNSGGQIYLNAMPITTNLEWMAQGGSIISTTQIENSCNFAQDAGSSKIGNYLNGYYFNGKIDEFGIWNHALTQQEVTDLYNSCVLALNVQPLNQNINISNNAQFITASSDPSASYQWQTDLGVGFQNLNSVGQYSGSSNDTLTVSNVTMGNNNQPFRCIINSGSCLDTSNVAILTVNSTVGNIDFKQNDMFSVYPNPTTSEITISTNFKFTSIKIVTNIGQIILSKEKSSSVSVAHLSKGIYFIELYDEKGNLLKIGKFIKE